MLKISGDPWLAIASSSAAMQKPAFSVFDSRQARTFLPGPVHDGDEIEKAKSHRDVGHVGTPDLIRPVDRGGRAADRDKSCAAGCGSLVFGFW